MATAHSAVVVEIAAAEQTETKVVVLVLAVWVVCPSTAHFVVSVVLVVAAVQWLRHLSFDF